MSIAQRVERRWLAPLLVGVIGVVLSAVAFWLADQADRARVLETLDSLAEWRARDLDAKVLRSGGAVENVAIIMAADAPIDVARFNRVAARAREPVEHVQSLQWAPRVPREGIADFERHARAVHPDYRIFDVGEDFQPTALADRSEYFPVLYDARPGGQRRPLGLALGRYDGRRIPMERARDSARPIATLPVRPIGPPSAELVFLLFWPVYENIEAPPTVEDRRATLRGYAIGNYNLVALLRAAVRDTPEIFATIYVTVGDRPIEATRENALAVYLPGQRTFQAAALLGPGLRDEPAVRLHRHFVAFGQHWNLTFDYSAEVVDDLRIGGAWGWLLAGLLLTTLLIFYLVRERSRRESIAAVVAERTAELQRTNAQLQQAQKMEAIGALTGGIAHDFNNLLSVVIGNVDLLREALKEKNNQALADAALNAALRGAELTKQLLAFARRTPLEPKRVDLNELVTGMMRMLGRTLEQNIEITLATAPSVWPVLIDPAQLSAAIANLATNARDAMPRGGRLTIATRNIVLDADYAAANAEVTPGEYVLLEMSDTGTGMAPDVLARAFEPFFTTKDIGKGTGLGLSMVFGFVRQSHGHVKIYSEVGKGTTMRIYLPRARDGEGEAVPREAPAAAPLARGRETVLLVEDNEDVRRIVVRQMVDLGYTVIEAANGDEALERLGEDTHVDLLFSDIIMPGGMDGRELARLARGMRTNLRVLFTSGYPGTTVIEGTGDPFTVEAFLSKPFTKAELARKLREVLEG